MGARGGADTARELRTLAAWRATIVDALAKTLALASLPTASWVAIDGFRLALPSAVWLGVGFVASTVACVAFRRLSARARSIWVVGNLGFVALMGLLISGAGGGVGALAVLMSVVAVLLLGAREAYLTLGSWFSLGAAWEILRWRGVVPRMTSLSSDMGDPANSLRAVFIALCLSIVALVATAFLLRQLSRSLLRTRKLAASQQQEMRARLEETQRRHRAERELLQSQRVEALGRLASGVAHDVNNNLTLAMGSAELLQLGGHDEARARRLCQSIVDGCMGASDLLRQLLALGRRDVPRPVTLDLRDTLRRLQPLLQASLGSARRLTTDVAADVRTVHVDEAQLRQVLLNLVLNARDATPDGGEIAIRVDAKGDPVRYQVEAGTPPRDAVRVHVRDTGTGIPDEVLPHMLDPFFTTKPADVGSGLGLAVARTFAESSGGRLGVTTQVGRGTTVTLELPARSASQPPAPPVVSGPVRACSVLVVDDDARVRACIADTLTEAGYRVTEAESGVEALAVAETLNDLDLLCTDAVMPRMGGQALIPALLARRPHTRVLVCSAYVHDEQLREALQEGRYASLGKPFTPSQLRDAVATVLNAPAPADSRSSSTQLGS